MAPKNPINKAVRVFKPSDALPIQWKREYVLYLEGSFREGHKQKEVNLGRKVSHEGQYGFVTKNFNF